jgi:hypothetical protein
MGSPAASAILDPAWLADAAAKSTWFASSFMKEAIVNSADGVV